MTPVHSGSQETPAAESADTGPEATQATGATDRAPGGAGAEEFAGEREAEGRPDALRPIPEIRSGSHATAGASAYRPARRTRHRSTGYRSRESRLRLLKLAIGFGGVVFFLTVLFMSGYIASVAGENENLVTELNRTQRQVAHLESRLQEVSSQRDLLVEDRIPNLIPLEYDQAIPLEQEYVRNVIFTLARDGDETRHEYRVVLHNDSLSVIHPEVRIVLFNEVGVQIGLATVERTDASSQTDRTLLDPGEVRSYSGTLAMMNAQAPRYFFVAVD